MKKGSKKLIAGAVIVLAAAGIILRLMAGQEKTEDYEKRPTVTAENPQQKDIILFTELTGTIEPQSRAAVKPKIGGELLEVGRPKRP